ncbi:MAG: PilZ domain-containing protein [Bacillota bacterium]|nr:PilZ domain-containing protein [Bacillota bacterium]
MGLKAGDVISVRHYSGLSPFKSIVITADNGCVKVKLTKEFALLNFLIGDPVVFGYESNDLVYIFGCNVVDISIREGIVTLKVDNIDAESNKRKYERFPVSLYADMKLRSSNKKHLATIKDMSCYGMLIYSKADIEVSELLDLAVYMDKSIAFFNTNVIRKSESANYFEYGLGIIHSDSNSLNTMKDYLKVLKNEQEEAVRKLINSR